MECAKILDCLMVFQTNGSLGSRPPLRPCGPRLLRLAAWLLPKPRQEEIARQFLNIAEVAGWGVARWMQDWAWCQKRGSGEV